VEDSGPGVPEGVEVFNLFETTKPQETALASPLLRNRSQYGGIIQHRPRLFA
jgi:hypothetical protein